MIKLTKFSSVVQTSQPRPHYVVSITVDPTTSGREDMEPNKILMRTSITQRSLTNTPLYQGQIHQHNGQLFKGRSYLPTNPIKIVNEN